MVKVDLIPTFWPFVEVLLIISGIDIMMLLLLKLKMLKRILLILEILIFYFIKKLI